MCRGGFFGPFRVHGPARPTFDDGPARPGISAGARHRSESFWRWFQRCGTIPPAGRAVQRIGRGPFAGRPWATGGCPVKFVPLDWNDLRVAFVEDVVLPRTPAVRVGGAGCRRPAVVQATSRRPGIIAAVSPLIPLAAGVAAIVAGWLILRTYGPRYRVGRLLASAPEVSVGEALALAGGPARYVRVRGRIDSETDFEDDAHRPLVFRRTRLQLRRGSGWTAFEDRRERVPFEIREGLDGIAIDDAALDAGLVVVPRESVGTAADVADRVPPGTSPETPVRLLVQQVSSIEHAIVLGVPGLNDVGAPRLSAGLGRPLVLTTLEPDEAIRILTGGSARRPLAAAVCLAGGLALVTFGLALALVGAVS